MVCEILLFLGSKYTKPDKGPEAMVPSDMLGPVSLVLSEVVLPTGIRYPLEGIRFRYR